MRNVTLAMTVALALCPGFPFNLPDGIGAIGLVLDPAGHPVGLYSRTPLPSAGPSGKR